MFFKRPFEYFLKPMEKSYSKEKGIVNPEASRDDKKLIELLRKTCDEPLKNAKKMPVYPFEELIKKFRTTDLAAAVETEQFKKMAKNGFILKSGEERIYYNQKPGQPSSHEKTNLHLGIDYVVESGLEVFAVQDGKIAGMEIIRKNEQELFEKSGQKLYRGEGGYGNMILIQHKLAGKIFYSLYGHLAAPRETPIIGDLIKKGEIIGQVGKSFSLENGGWPAHLHFNILKEQGAVAGYGSEEDLKKIIDPLKILK
ncbi:MAG: M23 family metallopeptidase [Patescibacteria group bacterium]|jgi:murein DD-endopeptidase MepM/ murein hydrolase activator NlpD|nr:M23 family metallopeptidase [Patescibacteria group bacterium]